MQYQKGKLFWKFEKDQKHIEAVMYDNSKEYYTFLKQCHESGFRQVIITSSIMLSMIEELVVERKFSITKIEFMEEDNELEETVNQLLENVERDRAYYEKLIKYLEFLSEKSSIDLKRIYFKGFSHNLTVDLFAQVNGIIGISKNKYDDEIIAVTELVERCLR